jgi:hypothetical protein
VKPRLLLLLTGSMAAPPVAWFAAQQATGSLTYFACQAAAPPLGLAIGLLSFAACWPQVRSAFDIGPPRRRSPPTSAWAWRRSSASRTSSPWPPSG